MRTSILNLKQMCIDAHQGTSFEPEQRGKVLMEQLDHSLEEFLAIVPDDLKQEYEDRYIAKCKAWLSAKSKTFSVMITGAGGFNNRRHDKLNNNEQSAYEKFQGWVETVTNRITHEKRLTGWEEVERLSNKLDVLTELQEKMKNVNKLCRNKKISEVERWDALTEMGYTQEEIQDFLTPRYAYYQKGYQIFEMQNNNAKIKRTKEAIERHSRMAKAENKEYEFEDGTIELNYADERVRIFFNDVPEPSVRERLRKAAFKWSPTNKAWQRQLTSNAIYSTNKLFNTQITL